MPEVHFVSVLLIPFFLVYLESVTHNDNLDKFIVTKGNQPQGKVGACTNHPEGKGGELYKSTTG